MIYFYFFFVFFLYGCLTIVSGWALENDIDGVVLVGNMTRNHENNTNQTTLLLKCNNGSWPKTENKTENCLLCIQNRNTSSSLLLVLFQFIKFYILAVPGILFPTALYISKLFTKPTPRSLYSTLTSMGKLSITRDWTFNKFMLQTSSCACFLLSNAIFLVKEFTAEVVFEFTNVSLKFLY